MELLKILYFREQPTEDMIWHTFVPSRVNYTLEELKNAKIEAANGTVKLIRHTRRTITIPPHHRVREQQDDGVLKDEDVFPYGWVKAGIGKTGNAQKTAQPLIEVGQGFSATLNRIVYEHLLKTFPPQTPFARNKKTSKARDNELEKIGLNPNETHTLQQRFEAFLKREKELEQSG